MKRINILLISALFAVIVSCSKSNLESIAYDRLLPATKEYTNRNFSIHDENTMFLNDSLCVIHFVLERGDNYKTTTMMEYVCAVVSNSNEYLPSGTYEYIHSIEGKKAVISVLDISIARQFSKYEWSRFSKDDIEKRPEIIYYENAIELIKKKGQIIE